MASLTTPKPGIYENESFEEYLSWNAINNSRLSLMAISPLHYHEAVSKEESSSMAIGSLVHSVILEPRALLNEYAVLPDYHLWEENVTAAGKKTNSKATSFYKQKCKAFYDSVGDRKVVTQEWLDTAERTVEAMLADPLARQVFTDVGPVEVSIVWEDRETGLLCKARLDKVATRFQVLIDIKTTRDLKRFEKAIGEYGYHRQAAHYRAGWSELTGEVLDPWIAAVDVNPPQCAAARPLSVEALEHGERQRRRLLNHVAICLQSGNWPPPECPDEWNVPKWAQED